MTHSHHGGCHRRTQHRAIAKNNPFDIVEIDRLSGIQIGDRAIDPGARFDIAAIDRITVGRLTQVDRIHPAAITNAIDVHRIVDITDQGDHIPLIAGIDIAIGKRRLIQLAADLRGDFARGLIDRKAFPAIHNHMQQSPGLREAG